MRARDHREDVKNPRRKGRTYAIKEIEEEARLLGRGIIYCKLCAREGRKMYVANPIDLVYHLRTHEEGALVNGKEALLNELESEVYWCGLCKMFGLRVGFTSEEALRNHIFTHSR